MPNCCKGNIVIYCKFCQLYQYYCNNCNIGVYNVKQIYYDICECNYGLYCCEQCYIQRGSPYYVKEEWYNDDNITDGIIESLCDNCVNKSKLCNDCDYYFMDHNRIFNCIQCNNNVCERCAKWCLECECKCKENICSGCYLGRCEYCNRKRSIMALNEN